MKKKKIIFCLIIASLFLCMNTKSSPLYKLNDWYDAQCFFTMGKSMMNGLVPYLDLFEQKGPLLFFIYGIASIISNTKNISANFDPNIKPGIVSKPNIAFPTNPFL